MTLQELIQAALAEDMPNGDITTDSLKLEQKAGQAELVAKQDLVLSGGEPFALAFKTVSPSTDLDWHFRDGESVSTGRRICTIKSTLGTLLKAERTALNFLGHLSGIATITAKYVAQTAGTSTKIIDTRKTTPLLRTLEKKAVLHGGGANHRMGLSDAILIKENHIRAAGSITHAIGTIRKNVDLAVEIEVTTTSEIQEALHCRAERLLLDNMTTPQIREAVELAKKSGYPVQTEASGNMVLNRIREVCQTGVDFISVGAITHSAINADVSLLFL